MNGAMYMIVVPAVLVAAGYIVVLRAMGIAPAYPRLIAVGMLLLGGIYWLSRHRRR